MYYHAIVVMTSRYYHDDVTCFLPQVESALSHELLSSPKTLNQEYYLLLAKLHMAKGELTEAESYVKQATVLNHTNPAAWALLGHILYLG